MEYSKIDLPYSISGIGCLLFFGIFSADRNFDSSEKQCVSVTGFSVSNECETTGLAAGYPADRSFTVYQSVALSKMEPGKNPYDLSDIPGAGNQIG